MVINSGAIPYYGHRAQKKRPCGIDVLGVVVMLVMLTFGAPTHAACPAAPVGSNQDRVIQMVAGGDGVTQMGSGAIVTATEEGAIVYDAANKTLAVCDGTNWVTLGGGVNMDVLTESNPDDVQVFNASGTWTKPAGAEFVLIEAIGGGGAGSRSTSNNCTQSPSGPLYSHGGAGGGFARRLMAATELGATEAVVVGLGQPMGYETGKGGDSSFGTHLTAPGGMGGGYCYDGVAAPAGVDGGGAGGSAPEHTTRGSLLYGARNGGDSIYGGAGGGAYGKAGGVSKFGGNGGASGVAGTAPGGGGGYQAAGAKGRVTVKVWF